MTGMFDVSQGTGTNNKVNCDTSCWACEFQNNGTAWSSVSDAELACGASALGYCKWTNSSSAFNSKGFCDYPSEMSDSGAKDCNVDCGGCDFVNDPETACTGSMANNGSGCNWVSEGDNNYCVPKTKKICSTDCFSCFNVDACQNSSISCSWDTTFGLCSPSGFTGEICFDMIDNDADTLVDCSDPDCGFDNFCGGSSFGGDCFAETTAVGCNGTLAFGALNCTWINDTWNPTGWCDMPGANCWKFDNDLTTCGLTSGCTNETSSMGSNSWCEMNMTKVDNANCWGNNNETACNLGPNCKWQNDTWCQDNPADTWCIANPNAGYCDYAPFATCYNLNEAPCTANINCTWNSDIYSNAGGWCEIACFNYTLDESECTTAGLNGLCEWRDASATCQPETFMMFGTSGVTGKTGCWQYDGNYTDCNLKNVTCTYKNDSYSNNNVSENEPSGWCMDKAEFEHFGEMEGDIIDLAFDPDNIMGAAEAGVSGVVDIMGMGMRVTDSGFDFGAGVYNMTSSMMCNGYGIGNPENPFAVKIPGTGNATTEFHWYLDTNGVESGECVAVPASGTNLTGFDFLISYVSRNTTNGVVETKQLKRCLSGSWVPTNALISTSKKLSCGDIGGVMVAVSKQDLEGFSDYNKSANMRIFMSSAGDGNSRLIPSDSVGLGYYTQGTIDFGFVDCSDPSMAKDSKCKNFQKFGFNVFEECKNGVDDDENGLVDCDDPFCSFIPDCASGAAFNFVVDSNDVVAPVVVFSDIEKLYDSAFVRVDTSEPSNLSLDFYRNDSTCMTLNLSLDDLGVDAYQANSNYKPFHSVDLFSDTLGYSLTNNTVYYYKIRVCDPSSNCGISACSNFTTKATSGEKSFIFKVDLPAGYTIDIPALNKTGYNFSESFGGTWYDVGIKTNTSVTKNMNMTIHCGDMSIGFFGMNILSPTGIDLTDAFICNEVSNLMGMNSSLKKWNSLINNLHLGGATDYIEITIPIAYSASNTFSWTNDIGASGQDVDDYVSCSDGGSSNTVCKVPVSMGFSAYTVVTPAADTPASSDSGGGGGGAMAATPSNNTAENNESASNEVPDEDDGDSIGDVANKVVDKIKEIVSGDKKNWAFGVIAVVLIGVIAGVIYFIRKRKSA